MIRIEDTIFSLDILEKKFRCSLPLCMGNCCRYGDAGAPLSNSEVHILKDIWPRVKPYLTAKGIKAIEENGTSVTDSDGEHVTPLINNEECAYTVINKGILMCGIEKAWHDGRISFQKPLSCHLFPARIKYFSDFRAVNYQELAICSPARKLGYEEGTYVYEFLREPLIRALGEKIYNELSIAAEELNKQRKWKQ